MEAMIPLVKTWDTIPKVYLFGGVVQILIYPRSFPCLDDLGLLVPRPVNGSGPDPDPTRTRPD